jgi:hypothetical protein
MLARSHFNKQGMVACNYNLSYAGRIGWRIRAQGQPWAKNWRTYLKKKTKQN